MSQSQQHSHEPEDILNRLLERRKNNYLRDLVYGGIDGSVTTFAIIAGVHGAGLSLATILILGVTNLIADGFSMAASNYLGTKAEHDEWNHIEHFERKQIEKNPAGEREEIRQILKLKGFEGNALEKAVEVFTSDKDKWVELMLAEEYGLPKTIRSAWKAGWNTFLAFIICGAIPLIPFLFLKANAFFFSTLLVGITFFAIGSFKSKWSIYPWYRSGLSTLAVGSIAALIAYYIGVVLGNV